MNRYYKKHLSPVIFTIVLTCSIAAYGQGLALYNLPSNSRICFDSLNYNYGTISEKEILTGEIPFKNIGTTYLIVSSCPTSCGCLTAEYPLYPIAPNEIAMLKFRFSPRDKSGPNTKSITINSNSAGGSVTIHIKCYIVD